MAFGTIGFGFSASGSGGGGLASISANNGLTANTISNVQLGGTLIQNTTITSGVYLTTITGAPVTKPESLLTLSTTGGLGKALYINSNKQALVIDSLATGIEILSSTKPISALGTQFSTFNIQAVGTTTPIIISFIKTATTDSIIGSGITFGFHAGLTNGGNTGNGFIDYKFENVSFGTEQTKFVFRPIGYAFNFYGATLEVLGSGSIKFNAYGGGLFTGTAAFGLGVDASGNVITTALPTSNSLQAAYDGGTTINNFEFFFDGANDVFSLTNGAITQTGIQVIAIGSGTAASNSGKQLVALGMGAADSNLAQNVVAIGEGSAAFNQGAFSNCVGFNSGAQNIGDYLVAVGSDAGVSNEGIFVNAIGEKAAQGNLGDNVVAIGYNAAVSNQATHVIALGTSVGTSNILNNVFIVSNSELPSFASNALAVATLSSGTSGSTYLYYNSTTFAIEGVRIP